MMYWKAPTPTTTNSNKTERMAPYTLEKPVQPGDFIILSAPGKAELLFVKHTSDGGKSTATASIIVKPISWRIPIQEGYWTLSGPKIDYWEEENYEERQGEMETDSEDEYAISDPYHYGIFKKVPLSQHLDSFNPFGANDTGKGEDTKIIVNPHGR